MPDPTNDIVVVYKDERGEWRWHRKDGDNGEVVSASTEGYDKLAYASAAAQAYNNDLGDEAFEVQEEATDG